MILKFPENFASTKYGCWPKRLDIMPRRFMRYLHANVSRLVVWVAFLSVGLCAAPDFDVMQSVFLTRSSNGDLSKFRNWRELITGNSAASEFERLKKVNDFFNRQIVFGEDLAIRGQVDYWATPLETLGRGAGDCEDFVIAKFFTLHLMGISSEKLRLIYVQARTGTGTATPTQAHMVLAFYPSPEAEPFVLDNLVGEIRPASRRPDLSPVFSFNTQGIYAGTSSSMLAPSVGSGRLSRWEDLLKRTRAEGFE